MKNKYFNTKDYLDYLLKNFEIEDAGKKEDYCTGVNLDIAYSYIDKLTISPSDHVLEIGCGIGRILHFIKNKYNCQISGTDISRAAIKLAKKRLDGKFEHLTAKSAEEMHFSPSYFNRIICWAVFDLTDQHISLLNMLGTLKIDGKILLTGKNDAFEEDDEEALIAEIKSREKGIPNHYTNFISLINLVELNGAKIIFKQFFKRRGDFAKENFLSDLPELFYEYCIIIQKTSIVERTSFEIASEYSKTWRNKYER